MSLPTGPPTAPLPSQASRLGSAATAATSPPPVRLSNHYIRRLTSSPKNCFVCSRPSPVVLVSKTAGAEDFFYVCASHLTDRHFGSLINKDAALTSAGGQASVRLPDKVPQDEIDRVKKEWEERQKAKKDKKEDKSDKDAKDKKEDTQGWLSYLTSSLSSSTDTPTNQPASPTRAEASSSSSATIAPPSGIKGHEEYCLHRSFYAMRVDAYNKKLALKRVQELNFPNVPRH